jgi:hypothetical protein
VLLPLLLGLAGLAVGFLAGWFMRPRWPPGRNVRAVPHAGPPAQLSVRATGTDATHTVRIEPHPGAATTNDRGASAVTNAVPPVPHTALALLFGPQADSSDAIAHQLASADPENLGRALEGLPQPIRDAAVREAAAAARRLLNANLLDVLVAGWRKHQDLTSAARRTLAVPGSTELVQLATHQVTEEQQPYISVLVDEHRVATLNLDLSVVFEVSALVAGISAGRLAAVHSGHCDITATLAVEGTDVVTRQTRWELPGAISLGKGIRLLPAQDYPPAAEQAETAENEPPDTDNNPPSR